MRARHRTAEDLEGPWEHREAVVNGVRLHYVEAGQGPLVVLLHGFPEFWFGWRFQLPELARAGFHVLAPDLRGYNLSEKPRGISSYRLPLLAGDVAGLIQHVGAERATVVGHDWGGGIAWYVAMARPECVGRLIILNAPHPVLYQRAMGTLSQLWRSWYVLVFQLPFLPELLCRWRGYALLRRALVEGLVRKDRVSRQDIEFHVRALARPGALTAAINYYRAAYHEMRRPDRLMPTVINAPTLVLWGTRDRYLTPRLTEGLQEWVKDVRVQRFPHASHWVQVDEAEQVNRAMITFLSCVRDERGQSGQVRPASSE